MTQIGKKKKKKKLTCLLSSSDFEKSWKPGCSFLFSFQAELVGINREHTGWDVNFTGSNLGCILAII